MRECRASSTTTVAERALRAAPVAEASRFPGVPRTQRVSCHETQTLDAGWELCAIPPGDAPAPDAIAALSAQWIPALVPGTVASAQRAASDLDLERAPDF